MRGQAREVRTVVVDRALHLRMRADMTLDVVRHARAVIVAGVLLVLLPGAVTGRPVTAAAVVVVGLVAWVGSRWLQLGRTMQDGLGPGQPITVSHRDGDDPAVVLRDVTGEVVLGRGSALLVTRFRSLVTVFGRQLSFVLPAGLLSEAEIAFLEGRGTTPDGSGDGEAGSTSALPLALRITEDVQRRAVAATVRAVSLSADSLTPVVAAVAFVVLGGVAGSGPLLTVGAVLAAFVLLTGPAAVVRARRSVRSAYPVGRTVRAQVTPEAITTEIDAVVLTARWELYDARRATADAVLLRRKGPFLSPDVFAVHPGSLFDDEAMETLAAAVPRTF